MQWQQSMLRTIKTTQRWANAMQKPKVQNAAKDEKQEQRRCCNEMTATQRNQ